MKRASHSRRRRHRRRRRGSRAASLTQIPNRLFFPPACLRLFISASSRCVHALFLSARSLASPSFLSMRSFFFLSPCLPRAAFSQILTYDYVRVDV